MNASRFLSIAVASFFSATGFAADPDDLAKTIEGLAQKEIDAKRAVGMTIGVARGKQIIHIEGYGLADIENTVPASPDSVYRIGSITKMFTAVAVLLLVEDGKLGLDDSLTKFLPDYPSPGEKVTVRHLLNHTSGIFSVTDLPNYRAEMRRDLSHEENISRFMDKPFHFPPGERFRYCNSGYYLLGMIVEMASEKKYEEFLQERIFDPLGMNATYYDRHVRVIPHRARGYSVWGEKTVNAPFLSMKQPFAAGALTATAGDLIKWQRALAAGDLLKPESFERMTTPGTLNDGKRTVYGFGCFVGELGGHPVVRHGGGIRGFVAELSYYPDSELTVVVLANTNRVIPKTLADRIARSLFSDE